MIFKEGNIAWKAIQLNGFLSKDLKLAELFMSLSGTIIVRQNGSGDDAPNDFSVKPSLASNKDLLKTLLNGGTAKVYECNVDEKTQQVTECLNPKEGEITITREKSLRNRVHTLLHSLAEKTVADTAIDKEEIGLIESTGLPIQKMLNVQAAFYKDEAIIDVSNYSDIIAIDILFQYLTESLNVVRVSTVNLQYPENIMSQFIAGMDEAMRELRAERKTAYEEVTTTTHLVQQTQMIENMLAGSFSSHLNQTLEWARGGH